MRSDLTDLTVVLDRSGSMATIQSDAEAGLNEFIRKQKEQPGDCTFTLVQFDTEYEFVHKALPIEEVPHCTLVPRGWTALLDAVGRAIIETGERLKTIEEDKRPGLVIFVIVTDGAENSSKEFTKEKIREMIEHQISQYNWQFTYLGANVDSFSEAGGIGIKTAGAANYDAKKIGAALRFAGDNVARMRGAASRGQEVSNAFTDEERKSMK
jgi:hypothetical protein